MLPARGLLRIGRPALGLAKTSSPSTTRLPLSRQFGTALRTPTHALRRPSTLARAASPLAFAAASHLSPRQVRNASTQSPSPLDGASVDPASLTDMAGTPIGLTGADLLDIPEQIGFLKTLGLDFGWGPTSIMQWFLESIHVYTGLPWWASISLAALAIKVALIKPSLDAQENSQKYQELLKNPKYAANLDEMKRLMMTGNHMAATEARARMTAMNHRAGYSMMKNFVPLIQLPIGFGMFRLVKAMAALPVPSFETGGLLWFTDLAVSDPFFILPVVAGIAMTTGMRIPLAYMAPAQAKTMKIVSLIVLPVSAGFTLFLPSGITLYFAVSSLLHLLQTWVLHQPWVRTRLGLPVLVRGGRGAASAITWEPPKVININAPRVTPIQRRSAAPETMFGSLKSTIADAKEKLNERSDKTDIETAHRNARQYEEKRALEEKEKLLDRMERKGRY